MVKRTFKQLREFTGIWNVLREKYPEIESTKFGYAITKFAKKNLDTIFKGYNSEVSDIQIERALTDPKNGAVLNSENNSTFPYQYSKDDLKSVIRELQKLEDVWAPKEFEVEPYICTDLSGIELNDLQKETFDGLIINVTVASEEKSDVTNQDGTI